MGLMGTIKSFVRSVRNAANISSIKLDNARIISTADHFADAGDDSFPLIDDYVVLVDIEGTGQNAAIGYADTKNEKKSEAGDKRIYGRNSDGDEVNEVWLKNDGSVILQNENGKFELESGGNVVINGVTIDTDGNISTAGGITAKNALINSKELDGHNHPINSGSSAPGPTGPNN